MKIDLNIPSGQRQRDFMDYLNSSIRGKFSSSRGTSGFNGDGLFETTISGPFKHEENFFHLEMKLVKDSDGSLLYLVADCNDETTDKSWESIVNDYVISVLTATVAEKREKFYRRSWFYYIGTQLDGEYWLPGFRFAPGFPQDPDPHLINAERVVVIDQEIEAIDKMHAMSISEMQSKRHSARLSLLLNIGLYSAKSYQRWVIPTNTQPLEPSVRYQTGFFHPELTTDRMPKKREQCQLGEYSGDLKERYRFAGQLISMPKEARRILRYIDNSSPFMQEAFDCCSRLYQVALVCGQHFPSVSLAYRVAAIEAISKVDGKKHSFSSFMRKNLQERDGLDSILNYLYDSVRSAHFHEGIFPLGEFDQNLIFNHLLDQDLFIKDSLNRLSSELTREAIVNWVISFLPQEEDIEE